MLFSFYQIPIQSFILFISFTIFLNQFQPDKHRQLKYNDNDTFHTFVDNKHFSSILESILHHESSIRCSTILSITILFLKNCF